MDSFRFARELPGYHLLTLKGKKYIEAAFVEGPARNVGEGSLLSVSGAYASQKFRYMAEYESQRQEQTYILASVLNDQVVDILHQPKSMCIVRFDRRGRRNQQKYVPDYLEFGSQEKFAAIQCKPLDVLRSCVESDPTNWSNDDQGRYQYLPAANAADELGITHRIFCADLLPPAFVTNLRILARVSKQDLVAEQPGLIRRVQDKLLDRPHSLGELAGLFQGFTGGYAYHAILQRKIFGLLEFQHFDKDFVLFGAEEDAALHLAEIRRLSDVQGDTIGEMHARYLRCSPRELRTAGEAKQRYDDRRAAGLVKNATDYRDDARMRLAKQEGAPIMAAFVRRFGDRGGCGRPLSGEIRKDVLNHATQYLGEGKPPRLSKMLGAYSVHAEDGDLYVPSRDAYRRIIHEELAPEKVAFLSGGKRGFHASRPMIDGRDANPRIKIAGLLAHIDGVYGDSVTKPDEEKLYLRPIYYPLIDDVTGYVYGRGIKIAKPSAIATLMAIRDCYQRHGFLPATLHHDWGSEFVNLSVPEIAAHLMFGYQRRPKAAPRFGGKGESFNSQFSAFLQSLGGGLYFDKAGRAADGVKKGRNTADADLTEMVRSADDWIFNTWNKTPIGKESKSPEERNRELLRLFPEAVVRVTEDELTRYYTSYRINVSKLTYSRGLRWGGERFGSRDAPEKLQRGEMPSGFRLDCMDPSIIRAMTKRGPTSFHSLESGRVQGLDIALRMEHQKRLFLSSSTASANQFERNVKEARQLADQKKVAQATKECTSEPERPLDAQQQRQGPIFTPDILQTSIQLDGHDE